MAESDTGLDLIARRIGKKPETVKGWLDTLIDGRSIRLSQIADILTAMACELDFHLRPFDVGQNDKTECME
jgi:hypothetical protein